MQTKGVLLINLGTPRAPTVRAVRAYLKEFLSDPLVIDVPWLVRQILLRAVILPFRPKQSAHAYQQIWTDEGSPLLVHSLQFKDALQTVLGDEYRVELGMRYGEPTIQAAVQKLYKKGCHKVLVFPMFPQYSSAASGSALLAAKSQLQAFGDFFQMKVCASFFDEPCYASSVAKMLTSVVAQERPDCVLFSYHGLPERQLSKAGCSTASCDRRASCLQQQPDLAHCYRAQCFKTTELVAASAGLTAAQVETSFQSRLGRTEWIHPYTDEMLPELRARGISRLVVISPSFVADCLETLEELGMRLRAQWLAMGGESFTLVPCLNAAPHWVNAFADLIRTAANFAQD